jgi:DNA end-binding protein Ku
MAQTQTRSTAKKKTMPRTEAKKAKKKSTSAKSSKSKSATKSKRGAKTDSENPRNMWSGSLSFGLLNIPVSLRSAIEEKNVSFDLLDKKNFGHIGYKQYNKSTGREVTHSQIVKGYEYKKGKYVLVTDADFKKANPRAVSTVDIEDFIDLEEMNPMFFEKPYYLVPAKNGEKGYRLLRDVMGSTRKIAIGRVVLFRKQRLVAILPQGDYLVLMMLRFARELLTENEMPSLAGRLKDVRISSRELEMAESLVEGMTSKWDPEKYKDTYQDQLIKLIENKAKKGTIEAEEEEAETEEVETSAAEAPDLMALLKKSLEKGGKGRGKNKEMMRH